MNSTITTETSILTDSITSHTYTHTYTVRHTCSSSSQFSLLFNINSERPSCHVVFCLFFCSCQESLPRKLGRRTTTHVSPLHYCSGVHFCIDAQLHCWRSLLFVVLWPAIFLLGMSVVGLLVYIQSRKKLINSQHAVLNLSYPNESKSLKE